MNDRIEMRKTLESIAESLSERGPDAFDLHGVLEQAHGEEFAISLHEYVYIMRRARISGFDAGVMTRLQWLSQQSFPHTPELVPFAELWKATFTYDKGYAVDEEERTWLSTITTRSIHLALDQKSFSEDMRDSFSVPFDCVFEETASAMRGTNVLTEAWDAVDYCNEPGDCAPGPSLGRFLTTMGLTTPAVPTELWSRLKYPRKGLWQASFRDEGDERNFEIEPEQRDHFTLSVDSTLTGPAGALDINVSFGLGPIRCSWLLTTTSDYLDDPSFIDRWNRMMESFQVVATKSEQMAKASSRTEDNLRRLITWRHLDLLGGDDATPIDNLEIVNPKTGKVSYPDPETPQEALAQFLAACEKLDGGDGDAGDGGDAGLSRADKNAFLARWQDRPEIQAWTDEQIRKAIDAGM
jgi:hypothetical protein